jgi:hypothetical protein
MRYGTAMRCWFNSLNAAAWRSIAARIGWAGEWRLGQIVAFKALLSILDLRNRGVGDSNKITLR